MEATVVSDLENRGVAAYRTYHSAQLPGARQPRPCRADHPPTAAVTAVAAMTAEVEAWLRIASATSGPASSPPTAGRRTPGYQLAASGFIPAYESRTAAMGLLRSPDPPGRDQDSNSPPRELSGEPDSSGIIVA